MSDRTDAEQRVIDLVAVRKGREYAEEHAAAIIAQAQVKGEVPLPAGHPLRENDLANLVDK